MILYSILLNLNAWYLNQIDVEKTKYLGYMFTIDKQDDVEMLRQLRLLYMRSNKIIRMFYFCTIDVKLELFRSFGVLLLLSMDRVQKNQLLTDCV